MRAFQFRIVAAVAEQQKDELDVIFDMDHGS